MHFHPPVGHEFYEKKKKKKKKKKPSGNNVFLSYGRTCTTFFSRVFDNFAKLYVSDEDLADRRMYADPDRLLLMFEQLIHIF